MNAGDATKDLAKRCAIHILHPNASVCCMRIGFQLANFIHARMILKVNEKDESDAEITRDYMDFAVRVTRCMNANDREGLAKIALEVMEQDAVDEVMGLVSEDAVRKYLVKIREED